MKIRIFAIALIALVALLVAAAGQAKTSLAPISPDKLDALLKKGIDNWKKYKKHEAPAKDFWDKFDGLTPDDEDFDNAYDDPTQPQAPSNCAGSDECGDCFEKAYENLNRQRFRLAKLERIYKSTMRMGKSAIAFGDNASGVHGVAGLGWQLQGRKPIEESMKSFQQTSVNKYEEIIGDLHGALQEVAVCEEEHYGEEDWYNRFGFIYYQFMAERYRPDAY